MSAFTYKFKSASMIKADAQKTGELFEKLQNTVGLTARNVVDVSRAEDSLLHNEFEWRDDIAAEKYREDQARHIIRSLVITDNNISEQPMRVFCKVTTEKEPQYMHINTIIQHVDLTKQMIDNALKELKAFRVKYSMLREYAEFYSMFSVIDNLLEKEEEDKNYGKSEV